MVFQTFGVCWLRDLFGTRVPLRLLRRKLLQTHRRSFPKSRDASPWYHVSTVFRAFEAYSDSATEFSEIERRGSYGVSGIRERAAQWNPWCTITADIGSDGSSLFLTVRISPGFRIEIPVSFDGLVCLTLDIDNIVVSGSVTSTVL